MPVPLHFSYDGYNNQRTVYDGSVGYLDAVNRTRLNVAWAKAIKAALAGNPVPVTVSFTTKAVFEAFTNMFPSGLDHDAIIAEIQERKPLIVGVAADMSSIEDAVGAPDAPEPPQNRPRRDRRCSHCCSPTPNPRFYVSVAPPAPSSPSSPSSTSSSSDPCVAGSETRSLPPKTPTATGSPRPSKLMRRSTTNIRRRQV